MLKKLWCRLFGHVKGPGAQVYWRVATLPGSGGYPASVGRTTCARCGCAYDYKTIVSVPRPDKPQLSDWQPISTPPALPGWYQVCHVRHVRDPLHPFPTIFWRRYADGRWYRPLEGSGEVIDAYEVAPPPGAQILLSADLTAYETIRWRGVL